MKVSPGQKRIIGAYELLELIGEGGMADVYLGIKRSFSNIRTFYAIKVVKPDHAADERFSRMFLDEARVMASIRHPNLVTLHDMIAHEGQYLIVMEYLKGLDARRLIRTASGKRVLPMSIAVNIIHQACVGLNYAHEAKSIEGETLQLVHRDISPHNLFVTFDGYVKVLDFGIAKSEIQHEETKSGVLKGKIPYLSPEQCASDAVIDRRTDVFALGVVLYEFLTGRRPFEGRNEIQIIQSILYSEPLPPTNFAPRIPAELSEVVMRAISNKPEDRFPDCDAFRDALNHVARRNGWTLTERALAKFMQDTEGTYAQELDARLVSLLNSSGESSNSQLTVTYDDTSSQKLVLGPDCVAAQRHRSDISGYRLSGQMRESFDPTALVETPHRTLVVDLAGVSRVTSFGIRQWLTMLPKLTEVNERVLLNRISVAMANQFVTIPAMTAGVGILSMMAPFRCSACGHTFDGVIRTGQTVSMVLPCVRCGENAANFDEDDAFLMPLANGVQPDAPLAQFLETLEGDDENSAATPVEKIVTSDRTEIMLRGDVPNTTRWDRLLAGVEGQLKITFAPGTRVGREILVRFESQLQRLEDNVTTTIWGLPVESLDALSASIPFDGALKSVTVHSPCPSCQHLEHREWKINGKTLTSLCRQCGQTIHHSLTPVPTAAPVDVEVALPLAQPQETTVAQPPASHKQRDLLFAGIVVVLVILILLIVFV